MVWVDFPLQLYIRFVMVVPYPLILKFRAHKEHLERPSLLLFRVEHGSSSVGFLERSCPHRKRRVFVTFRKGETIWVFILFVCTVLDALSPWGHQTDLLALSYAYLRSVLLLV